MINRLALFPMAILPISLLNSIAAAPFNVEAFNASSGSIFSLIQANETTKFMFPDGVDPGL
ncbi:hypothetical protein D9M68_856590 [compost metagenome]